MKIGFRKYVCNTMFMSEELNAKGMITSGQKIGDFEYYCIGSTTLNQLAKAGVIPKKDYKKYATRKPDRLLIKRQGKTPKVIAVIEDKDRGKFVSSSERTQATQQCNDLCQELDAVIGIATDGETFVWVNPQQEDSANEYLDRTTNKTRSYTIIENENGKALGREFIIDQKGDQQDKEMLSDRTGETVRLIEDITQKISSKNSIITAPKVVDPFPLARNLWQSIWIATGKSPEKCLYNVVELFIFKFLSDLGVLPAHFSFDSLVTLSESASNKDVLNFYADNCRPKIRELFREGDDGTTIINGTIFVNEYNKANVQHAALFKESLSKFKDFEEKYGKFQNIDKNFKTKLFESFLKQSAGQKNLGQYFTPRKVVRSIVRISSLEEPLQKGFRFCDPFCGVGGFLLEPINLFTQRLNDFKPRNGKIEPGVTYLGFDKGSDEKDEERTIILAKANMLIYLSELVIQSPHLTDAFSGAINNTFHLIRSNLGTLGKIFEEDEKFDLIITNPPYVTKGKKTLINEINEDRELQNAFAINAGGVEGLALEWIIRNLKKNGRAFVIVPDGILHRKNDAKMREFLLNECFLDAIISLPKKTFFATPKKTYILAITKKDDKEKVQSSPVFTYLVSDIGETLDVNRFDTDKSDLIEMEKLFKQFKVIREDGDIFSSPRCKIQIINKFQPDADWRVDRWWSNEEKIALGIEEPVTVMTVDEYVDAIADLNTQLSEAATELKALKISGTDENREVELKEIIDFSQKTNTSKFTKNFINQHKGSIPVYSASNDPDSVGYGYVRDNLSSVKYFEDCMTWNIDGSIGKVFIRTGRFSLSEKVIPLVIFDKHNDKLDKLYLKYAIEEGVLVKGFDFSTKAGKSKLADVTIQIPVDSSGNFDLEKQKQISELYEKIGMIKSRIADAMEEIGSYAITLH